MSINPPSDIVLDVARAADPARAEAVAQRLTALSSSKVDPTADFASALADARTNAPAPAIEGAPDMRSRLASVGTPAKDPAAQAQIQFEAVLLNNFVSEMLPKDAPSAYGQGLAGDMWRSMLADQVSRQIASSGTLGIGRRLFASHPMSASSSLTHAAPITGAGHAATAQMSANEVSMPDAADYADGAYLFRGAKRL